RPVRRPQLLRVRSSPGRSPPPSPTRPDPARTPPATFQPPIGRSSRHVMAIIPAVGNPFDEYCLEQLNAADTLLLGRNSYLAFKSFWPQVEGDRNFSKTQREISRLDNELDKAVI